MTPTAKASRFAILPRSVNWILLIEIELLYEELVKVQTPRSFEPQSHFMVRVTRPYAALVLVMVRAVLSSTMSFQTTIKRKERVSYQRIEQTGLATTSFAL